MKNLVNQLILKNSEDSKLKNDIMFKKASFATVLTSLIAIQDEAVRLGFASDDPKVNNLLQQSLTAAGWLDTDYIKALSQYEEEKRNQVRIENEKKDHTRKN